MPGDPFTFTVDASRTGWGEVAIDVVYENRSIRRTFYVEEVANRVYKVRLNCASVRFSQFGSGRLIIVECDESIANLFYPYSILN